MPVIPDYVRESLRSIDPNLRCVQGQNGHAQFIRVNTPQSGDERGVHFIGNIMTEDGRPRSPTDRDLNQLRGGDLGKRKAARLAEVQRAKREKKEAERRHSKRVYHDAGAEGWDILRHAERDGNKGLCAKQRVKRNSVSPTTIRADGKRLIVAYDHYGNEVYRAR